jgi:hypothetical protein
MKIVSILLLVMFWAGCGGYGSSSGSMPPAAGIVPSVAELAPDNVNAGSPGFMLTINGTNFNTDAVVKWNGTSQTTTYITGKQLTAAIPATNVATAGTASVTVMNPGRPGGGPYGGGGTMSETSKPMTFTVN